MTQEDQNMAIVKTAHPEDNTVRIVVDGVITAVKNTKYTGAWWTAQGHRIRDTLIIDAYDSTPVSE